MDSLDFDILNAITKYQRLALDFAFQYDDSVFVDPEAKSIARSIISYVKLYKSKPSRRTLTERHNSDQSLVDLINKFYDEADNKPYNENDYAFDIGKLKDRFGLNKIEDIKKTLAASTNDVSSVVKSVQCNINEIKALNGAKAYNRISMKGHLDDFVKSYVEKQKNPDLGKGILTKFSFFDYITNGLRPADLVIICGETGGGKSILMNNMAKQIWMQENTIETPKDQFKKGYNVTYFSLEMPHEDCFRRTMACLADVPAYGLRDAKLSRNEALAVKRAGQFIKNYPHEFDIIDVPRGFSVEQLELTFEDIKNNYVPDVIFIDYLGLMEDANEGEDWLALGKLAGRVHEFGRAHGIPVVTAVQLNRIDPAHRKTESKAVGLHRIGRSSLIATHATTIIQIETRIDEESHDDFIYHIIKNRHGESNKSHSIYKNFSRCAIIDKPYDAETAITWTEQEDLSTDISDILGSLDE